jgi:hypothetical protein
VELADRKNEERRRKLPQRKRVHKHKSRTLLLMARPSSAKEVFTRARIEESVLRGGESNPPQIQRPTTLT